MSARAISDRAAVAPFALLLRESAERLPGADLEWLTARRASAIAAAERLGLPTQRAEAWRHTSLRALAERSFALPMPGVSLDRAPTLLPDADRLVFLEGLYDANLSRPPRHDHVGARSLSQVLEQAPELLEGRLAVAPEGTALGALNLGLFQDGALVVLAPQAKLARPLELTFVNGLEESALTAHPRLEILLEAGAEAVLVEQHLGFGAAPRFLNYVSRIALGEGAGLTHLVLLAEGAGTTHLAETAVTLARDARYDSHILFAGGGLCRRALNVVLQQRGAAATVNGAYLLAGQEQGELASEIRHAAPDTVSRETFKGALAARSRQGIQACITVEAGAARADGRLACKTILLDDGAEIDAKPELRIFHDDVQCAHGATAGKLDEAALFYLRSRGIPEARARSLLLGAFLEETLQHLPEALRLPLAARIERRLAEVAP